ncbi:MAG TPA: hypothetical protein VIR01_08845, partial [Pyrinomonadaceae bacterium]
LRGRPFVVIDCGSMWRIENPELRSAKLDFTSSEQGVREVTQLFVDEVQLINAIELVEWNEEEAQFLICEDCGFSHCKSGDWVRVRRTDSLVLILPSFNYVAPERPEETTEYRPPRYLKERGIAYVDRAAWEELSAQNASFPSFDQIAQLNPREATLLSHWAPPAQGLPG